MSEKNTVTTPRTLADLSGETDTTELESPLDSIRSIGEQFDCPQMTALADSIAELLEAFETHPEAAAIKHELAKRGRHMLPQLMAMAMREGLPLG